MWEFTNFDNLEPSKQLGMERRLWNFDVVVGYDEVSAGALREKTDRPVGILQGGYDPTGWDFAEDRDWSGTFRYIMVGQLHLRKQPFVAIEAFNILKARHGKAFDAELHLKTNVQGLHPAMEQAYPGLHIHYAYWTREQLKQFYARSHMLLAPSMGEGKNVPALEFQTTGGVVAASDFGGHQNWLHPAYSWPIPVELASPFHDRPRCKAAKVDPEQLAEIMWEAYCNREVASHKGRMAATVIPQTCSWDAVTERLWTRVAEWGGEAGFMVKVKAQACNRELVNA
jgi:glycosyltransferase involved in cell wall biosynthesis